MMYDPKTGKSYKANKPEDHERMAKMGYKHEPKEEMTTTASIPNPADTAMGPRIKTTSVTDRRRRKDQVPVLLKRFRKYMEDNA